ncbi:MAG: hypothetical protein KUG82_13545 [Pseudomonadales bacterium]|nr:hypothetical protein [Pseudomonadales bacterium]
MPSQVRKKKIQPDQLTLGAPLEWPIYDCDGILLFKTGSKIHTPEQLELLSSRNAHFLVDLQQEEILNQHIFDRITQLVTLVALSFDAINKKQSEGHRRILQCVKIINDICEKDADGALGAVHLFRDHTNTLLKPIFSGILANIIARRIRYPQSRTEDLVTAMLLCNIASMSYQAELDLQTTPLTESQKDQLSKHPEEGFKTLLQANINTPNVLQAVLQHHERSDGSGYPRGITEQNRHMDGKILALCEYYVAVTATRRYKPIKQSQEALREIYVIANTQEPYLYMQFIKELGAFPPGSIVKLANKEIAIITRRQEKVIAPISKAIISPAGKEYTSPKKRDCSLAEYKIVGGHKLDLNVKLDLVALWDYENTN